jgi:hypothetical protein
MLARPALALLAVLPSVSPAMAQPPPEVEIAAEQSVLAVVTHKAGFASGLAHDHLVVADPSEARLAFSPERPDATTFSVEVTLSDLVADDPTMQERWYPDVEALGVLAEPFGSPSEEDRVKIRGAMLGRGQLDAERHPTLRARLLEVTPEPTTVGSVEHGYRLAVEISLRGVTRRESFTARLDEEDGAWRFEALGALLFSDYGIEPYSAFLGAVKNQDRFHVLVSLVVPR